MYIYREIEPILKNFNFENLYLKISNPASKYLENISKFYLLLKLIHYHESRLLKLHPEKILI